MVSVDENGNVTALREGEAVITAVSQENNSIKQECRIVVRNIPTESIKLNTTILLLSTSKNYNKAKLVAEIVPSNAANKDIIWKSSSDKIISVDTNGNVIARADGVATVTVSTKDGRRPAKCDVIVSTVKSISINKTKVNLKKGQSIVLSYKISPLNASIKGVVWKSSDSKKVLVNSSGKVTAVGVTTKPVIISAVSKDNEKILAACVVNVSK